MSKNNHSTPTFEQSVEELEHIVKAMEQGDLPLEEALAKFERGIELSRLSQQALTQAQQRVQVLLQKNGEETLAPLADGNSEAE